MRDMIWVPGIEVEEDEMYGAHMPTDIPTDLKVPERVADDQCDYCRAPAGCPHHVDCPEE